MGKDSSHENYSNQILLISDDHNFNDLFKVFLKEYDCECIISESYKNIIHLFKNKFFNPSYCFLDYKLLRWNSEEIFKEIKKQRPSLKVIVLSHFLNTLLIDSITSVGHAFFIKKPSVIDYSFLKWIFSWLDVNKKDARFY